jgi:hypothetical protein
VDGTTKTLKPEQALAVWHVLNGDAEPENRAQSDFCDKVKRLYLNRENAPQSYLDRFPQGYDVPRDKQKELWHQK